MFTTAQCQKPRTVGASGSTMVTTKLCVADGKPLQESCGETSCPPAPKMPLTCGISSFSPSVRSLLVSEKEAAGAQVLVGVPAHLISPVLEVLVDALVESQDPARPCM